MEFQTYKLKDSIMINRRDMALKKNNDHHNPYNYFKNRIKPQ